jgi:hypothetical protein
MLEELKKAQEYKPRTRTPGEHKAFKSNELTSQQVKGVIEYVNQVAQEYFNHENFKWYLNRVTKLQYWINQEPPPNEKGTATGFVKNYMRAGYDYYTESLLDIYDVDDLVMFEADGSRTKDIAEDLGYWVNNLLRIIKYKKHLFNRFQYIPDYGWSLATDRFIHNSGWEVPPKVSSVQPGAEAFNFTVEQDPLQSWPKCRSRKPTDWFGSPYHTMDDMPFEGYVDRLYIQDLYQRRGMTDANDNALYNVEAIDKCIKKVSQGERIYYNEKDGDRYHSDTGQNGENQRDGRSQVGFVEVMVFYSTLERVKGFDDDNNKYYMECTADDLLRFDEAPIDRRKTITHIQSHPMRDTPFSRSFLDSIRDHQVFGDTLTNIALENALDSAHRYWAYWEEDIVNYENVMSPEGLNTFLQLQGNGRVPQLIEGRSSTLGDIINMIQLVDKDKEALTWTKNDLGVGGEKETATKTRKLASESAKKIRAFARRANEDGIKPQIENIVMMQLFYGNPQTNRVLSPDGRQIQLTQEHIEYFVSGAGLRLVDQITQDWNEMANKLMGWFQMGSQILPQLATPGPAVEVLREGGRYSGIPQAVIDKVLPEDGMQPAPMGGLNVEEPMAAPVPGEGGLSPMGEPPPPA